MNSNVRKYNPSQWILCLLLACVIPGARVLGQDRFFTTTANITLNQEGQAKGSEYKTGIAILFPASGDLQWSVQGKDADATSGAGATGSPASASPFISFSGRLITDSSNFSRKGSYPVIIDGMITIGKVTERVRTNGVLLVKHSRLQLKAGFDIHKSPSPGAGPAKEAGDFQIQFSSALLPQADSRR